MFWWGVDGATEPPAASPKHGDEQPHALPARLRSLAPISVASLSCGRSHCALLSREHTVHVWRPGHKVLALQSGVVHASSCGEEVVATTHDGGVQLL